MLGESVSFGGAPRRGFSLGGFGALGAAGDPDLFAGLQPNQQAWVQNALITLNTMVTQATGTSCPTWAPAIPQATGCFQAWYNANYGASQGGKLLRTDGVVDIDTLSALQMIAGMHPSDFTSPYPQTAAPLANPSVPLANPTTPAAPPTAVATTDSKKLSTGEMVGIGLGGAALLGGIVYAATRPSGGGRRKRR